MPRPRLRPDLSAFYDSRDLRLIVGGTFVADLGAQATLVALPYQLYILTRSPFLVGLLGAVELGPLVASSLLAGVIADRIDRRRLLLLGQAGVFLAAAGLAAVSVAGHPAVVALYALAALLAGGNALVNVAQTAIIPNLVDRRRLPRGVAMGLRPVRPDHGARTGAGRARAQRLWRGHPVTGWPGCARCP